MRTVLRALEGVRAPARCRASRSRRTRSSASASTGRARSRPRRSCSPARRSRRRGRRHRPPRPATWSPWALDGRSATASGGFSGVARRMRPAPVEPGIARYNHRKVWHLGDGSVAALPSPAVTRSGSLRRRGCRGCSTRCAPARWSPMGRSPPRPVTPGRREPWGGSWRTPVVTIPGGGSSPLTGRLVPGHEAAHARRLRAEGVEVRDGRVAPPRR